MSSEAELRRRGGRNDAAADAGRKPMPAAGRSPSAAGTDADSAWLDALRVLTFVLFALCGISYLVRGDGNFIWGVQTPIYLLKPAWWRSQLRLPLRLTPDELAAYDGNDASKPLYLAVNGTIYDVTQGWRFYGPGGSYHPLAGRDSARAFVTTASPTTTPTCAASRPFSFPSTIRASMLAGPPPRSSPCAARSSKTPGCASTQPSNTVDFFANNPKYHKVGYLKHETDWLDKLPRKELCAKAQ